MCGGRCSTWDCLVMDSRGGGQPVGRLGPHQRLLLGAGDTVRFPLACPRIRYRGGGRILPAGFSLSRRRDKVNRMMNRLYMLVVLGTCVFLTATIAGAQTNSTIAGT